MKSQKEKLLILSLFALLSGCGGSGTEGNESSTSSKLETSTGKEFSLSLSSVDVRRVSNGEMIVVDSALISSGTLKFNE